ncbi:hypothetical protein BD779DRAFT_1671025 [Infundibulicybe gibba]|nr:hypothetical protein BD779DRAFT_1671025 [Infundibulicybe gibba]
METTSPPTHHQFGAIDFLPALTNFLQQHYPTCPVIPNIFDRFDLYKIITITLPPNPYISQQTRTNRIRAIPSIPPCGRNPGSAANFDTALIIEDPSKYESHGGISGLRVAQVRAIFDLPHNFSALV